MVMQGCPHFVFSSQECGLNLQHVHSKGVEMLGKTGPVSCDLQRPRRSSRVPGHDTTRGATRDVDEHVLDTRPSIHPCEGASIPDARRRRSFLVPRSVTSRHSGCEIIPYLASLSNALLNSPKPGQPGEGTIEAIYTQAGGDAAIRNYQSLPCELQPPRVQRQQQYGNNRSCTPWSSQDVNHRCSRRGHERLPECIEPIASLLSAFIIDNESTCHFLVPGTPCVVIALHYSSNLPPFLVEQIRIRNWKMSQSH
ncbi:uncharacterized protein F5Z01DRAFT_414030 [Emericellopsis atlantica]|uniref:Uncharacterized protein n=1 Tax=Emericellopsis atlantica TaxID=2614577 RepID=A0A9P8CSV1_9HYPO|nr:uncharacterized protein F5Z01DRAFT_414030 [Emericellopsis atlantica]KAG9257757.1 hypothetical protein F5Z01DRAFT_414030 [Emericellopsis atlantica]